MIAAARVTCPHCSGSHQVRIRHGVRHHALNCPACMATVHADVGECCVLCAYGSVGCEITQHRERRIGQALGVVELGHYSRRERTQ